jgi:AraC-like DNA-binding protein
LTAVAQALGASVFHFCKVFKKTTGLNFTDYVAALGWKTPRTSS